MTDRKCRDCNSMALCGSDYCFECERAIREQMREEEAEFEAYLERYDKGEEP